LTARWPKKKERKWPNYSPPCKYQPRLSGFFYAENQEIYHHQIGWILYQHLELVCPQKATLLAYRLFSTPREGRLSKDALPTVLKDAETQTIHLGDDHFQIYIWHGSETVTLLVHGWESNASRWEKLLPHLKTTGNTIVAIDAPAHGLSSGSEFNVPQYAKFIDTVIKRYQPKHIVGHSIGGISSVYFQHHYEGHGLEKMVLLGAPSDFKILLSNYVRLLWLNDKVRDFLFDKIKKNSR
jgi:pimeloyl-ACP methyl ester carboxylesterase